MNRKAEAFKKYLEEKNITCFVIDKIADDKLNTVVFRSYIEVEKQQLPTIMAWCACRLPAMCLTKRTN